MNRFKAPIHEAAERSAHSLVRAPAIALITVASIALVFGILGLLGDVVLIASGAIAELEARNEGPISKETTVAVRMIWGILLLVASSFVLFGAIAMKNLKRHGIAKAAAIVAMVPLVGPCCLLGIPFGVWALITLEKPAVRKAFR
jgi:hypothetical protein